MYASMDYGANMEIFKIAERLRRDMTAPEKIIWDRVCKNQPGDRRSNILDGVN